MAFNQFNDVGWMLASPASKRMVTVTLELIKFTLFCDIPGLKDGQDVVLRVLVHDLKQAIKIANEWAFVEYDGQSYGGLELFRNHC